MSVKLPGRRERRWGVLISGRGSNLAAVLDLEIQDEVDIQVVVSSTPNAYGLLRARRAGVPAVVAPFLKNAGKNTDKNAGKIDWHELDSLLRSYGVTHILLAGFMKIVPKHFVHAWSGRILNLHPSLLPSFPGLKSIERAHHAGEAIGVTIHEVNEEVDSGKIICQRRSLNTAEVRGYPFDEAEFFVHVDEQRVVKEAIRRWKPEPS